MEAQGNKPQKPCPRLRQARSAGNGRTAPVYNW